MKPLDIAIAGCGPAGLAAALHLVRDGHRVTAFERFAAPRPRGSGLIVQPVGMAVLAGLGLKPAILAKGARIDRLFGRAASGRIALDVRYAALEGRAEFGLGLHRAELFGALFEAALDACVGFEPGREVVGAAPASGDRRRLAFKDGRRAGPFDLVVDALGASSSLAPREGRALPYGALWANVDWPAASALDGSALEQRYSRASAMAGVMPIGSPGGSGAPQAAYFWSLRWDRLEDWRREGLDAWKAKALGLWPATEPLLAQIDAPERLVFARYSHRTLARPAERALVHVGDAWHSTSPQLGQGANMALLDAFALAQALRSACDLPEALARAVALRRWHVALYQGMSRIFTPAYQSDSRVLPWARDRMAGPIAKLWPAHRVLAKMVGGLLGDPLGRLGLPASAPAAPLRGPAPVGPRR